MSLWDRVQGVFRRRQSPRGAVIPDEILGYTFSRKDLLQEALTHRSWANTIGGGNGPTYERLEFLGDSVLGVLVAHFLHERYPDASEGDLTKKKASVVNVQSLAEMAKRHKLGRWIRLSVEEDRTGGRERPSILSDVVESIIGAAYLDGGLDAAQAIVTRLMLRDFDRWAEEIAHVNYKGELLELMQGKGFNVPRYDVVAEAGPDHDKTYEVIVWANGKAMGRGRGGAKKDAEQKAAQEALEKIRAGEDV